ncbi:MAG: ATP-dependent endonuclease [Gammaproteobacteria bacterium]|nr:MAG: ATP-dependent endonuclease [Gammaproteobacteria bacterium]
MHINKIIITNYKKFEKDIFKFNDDINILVGDNDSGKSTILEAIEICFNCSYRGKPLTPDATTDLFNSNSVHKYFESNKEENYLPEIKIEIFISGVPEYRGEHNSLGEDSQGILIRIKFDDSLSDVYQEFVDCTEEINTIPKEFYKIEWLDFSGKKVKFMSKKMRCLFVDPASLHPTHGRNQYISKIVKTTLSKDKQALLNLNYRQLKQLFNNQPQVQEINKQLDSDDTITDKSLKIVADVSSTNGTATGMQLAVNDINFPLIGRGEQNKIQLKLAIQNKANNIDVLMVEEPENHLSHSNLGKLVRYIEEQRKEKQLFITTHSSFVLNKLSLNKLCLISEEYIQLKKIDKKIVRKLKRLPGYDTLRIVLSNKVILVEGPSDELILKKIYLNKHHHLPEENEIDIIVVRGIGFKNYLEIAKHIKINVHVVKDNDGDFKKNIESYSSEYKDYDYIKFYSPENPALYSLEPVMIDCNSSSEQQLDKYAKTTLSTTTYKIYAKNNNLKEKKAFLIQWYQDKGGAGTKKVDSAMRIFDSDVKIDYPSILNEALCFE